MTPQQESRTYGLITLTSSVASEGWIALAFLILAVIFFIAPYMLPDRKKADHVG